VHFLLNGRHRKFFFARFGPDIHRRAMLMRLSQIASLDRRGPQRTIRAAPPKVVVAMLAPVNASVHRFEESIGGRPYLIEVAPVTKDRWRAYIVRIPGVPTALMPFYGPTPDEAASLLRQWLTRAHERAGGHSS
jgi:hypothetical protein